MTEQRLSPEQAFAAMSLFLGRYYARTSGNGDLGALLGDLQLNGRDGLPLDPAAWPDWLAAIEAVLEARDRAEQPVAVR